jgi:hypothetical protein
MSHYYVFSTLLFTCVIYGFLRGGPPEKIGTAIFSAGALLSSMLQSRSADRFQSIDVGLLSVDIVGMLTFVILAIISNRFWPLWISAMQLITVFSHMPAVLQESILPWAYWRAISMWSYPMLFLLVAGTWWHQKRLKQSGRDDPWKPSLHL